MRRKYKILQDPDTKSHPVGTVIQDKDGIKWQLIKPDKWIKYNYSYMHKTKPKRPNLKTNTRK